MVISLISSLSPVHLRLSSHRKQLLTSSKREKTRPLTFSLLSWLGWNPVPASLDGARTDRHTTLFLLMTSTQNKCRLRRTVTDWSPHVIIWTWRGKRRLQWLAQALIYLLPEPSSWVKRCRQHLHRAGASSPSQTNKDEAKRLETMAHQQCCFLSL